MDTSEPKVERAFTSSSITFSTISDKDERKALRINTADAQWMSMVQDYGRKIYLQFKYKNRIPCAKVQKERSPIGDDDGDDDCDSPFLTTEEETIAASKVTEMLGNMALDRASLSSTDSAGSPSSTCAERADSCRGSEDVADWRQKDQLEHFLSQCARNWDMQAQLIEARTQLVAENARLQSELQRIQQRAKVLEDENSLLAWYAHHTKGGSAAGSEGPLSIEAVIQQAEVAVLTQAAATIKDATAI